MLASDAESTHVAAHDLLVRLAQFLGEELEWRLKQEQQRFHKHPQQQPRCAAPQRSSRDATNTRRCAPTHRAQVERVDEVLRILGHAEMRVRTDATCHGHTTQPLGTLSNR